MTKRLSTCLVLLLLTLLICGSAQASVSTTLGVTPTTVSAGGQVQVSWSGVANPTAGDWIGLYASGAANTDYVQPWFHTDSCTKTINYTLRTSGTCAYTMSSGLAAGTYEFRLLANSSNTNVLAVSPPLTVNALPCYGSTPSIHEYVDGCPLYHPASYVNSPLPSSAPVAPNSASMTGVFMSQIGLNSDGSLQSGAPGGDRWNESVDVYVTKSADTSTWKSVCSTEVLDGSSWAWMNDLHNAWMTTKVPVPADTSQTDGGSDRGLTIYDAATGQAWDFYEWKGAAPAGTTDPQGRSCDYEAAGGSYDPNVANSPGYFVNKSLDSGVQEDSMWGRRASALPSFEGVITPDEWNHPLPDFGHSIQMIVPCASTTLQYWPATRHDGCNKDGTGGLPEGSRVRIDPSYTCYHGTGNATTQLAYDRAYALCATIQKYGAVIGDQTGGGAAFTIANPIGGKSPTQNPDGGNCCSANTPPGTGRQWPNWYWDVGLDAAMPHLQVIDQSYRPSYAPAQ